MQTRLFNRTRLQLAGWYACVMGLILSLCGLVIYQVIIRAYSDSMARELETVSKTLLNGVELTLKHPGRLESNIQQLLPDICLTGAPSCLVQLVQKYSHTTSAIHHIPSGVYQSDYYIRFLDNSKKLVASSGLRLNLPPASDSKNQQIVVDLDGVRFRQIALPLHTPNHQLWGYLQVGRSLKDLDDRLAALQLSFLVGLPIIVILVGISSWWLARLAMHPIHLSYQQMQQFTTDVAHELRTPLTAILATVDSVLRLPSLTELETRDSLKTIERQVSRFFELVKDLLLLSRLEQHTLAGQPELLCLNELIDDLIEEFSALAAAKNLMLVPDVRLSKRLSVLADEDHICRLISNLVINAIQYTPAGGHITLRLDCEEQFAIIQVQDTGIGIPSDKQAYIFDRFYRINSDRSRQTGGAGLGLAIARAIVEAHGGSLHLQSEVGKGSTFNIRLPLRAGMALSV